MKIIDDIYPVIVGVWNYLGGGILAALVVFICCIILYWPVHDRFVRNVESLGLTILPYRCREGRNLLVRTSSEALLKSLLRGALSKKELLLAAKCGMLAKRTLEDHLVERVNNNAETIEVYADRLQGRSAFLAQVALRLAGERAVLFGSWGDLGNRLDQLRGTWWGRVRWEVPLFHAPLKGFYKRPWIIVDDCPAKVGEASQLFESFLTCLDASRIPFIVGVLRYRSSPGEEDHAGWVDSKCQLILELESEEALRIATHWIALLKPEIGQPISSWVGNNRNLFKGQLFAMLSLALEACDRSAVGLYRPLVDRFEDLEDEDRQLVKWVSFGQLLDIALPEEVIRSVFKPQVLRRARATYGGLLRRDSNEPGSPVVYHLGGPVLARVFLKDELHSEESFQRYCYNIMRTCEEHKERCVAEYMISVLNRMALGWNPSLESLNQRGLAVGYKNLVTEDRLRMTDKRTRLMWADTLRGLGDREGAGLVYETLFAEVYEDRDEVDCGFYTSLLLSVKSGFSGMLIRSQYVRDIATKLAQCGGAPSPRLAIGLSDAFCESARGADNENRNILLSRAEVLATTALQSRQTEKQAYNILARLVGGILGPYMNDRGRGRPDHAEAIDLVKKAFESGGGEATSWHNILTHHVAGCIYVGMCDATENREWLEHAEGHFVRSYEGLPRETARGRDRSRETWQYLLGLSNHGFFRWQRMSDNEGARRLYKRSVADLENIRNEEWPNEAWRIYWNYAYFCMQTGAEDEALKAYDKMYERCRDEDYGVDRDKALGSYAVALSRRWIKVRGESDMAGSERIGERFVSVQEKRMLQSTEPSVLDTICGQMVGAIFARDMGPTGVTQEVAEKCVGVLADQYSVQKSNECVGGALSVANMFSSRTMAGHISRVVESIRQRGDVEESVAMLDTLIEEAQRNGWRHGYTKKMKAGLERYLARETNGC